MNVPLKFQSLIFVTILGILFFAVLTPAHAQTTTNVGCDVSELITAITNANASAGNDILELASGCTYTLTAVDNTADGNGSNGLPAIVSAATGGTLTITGNGATIRRDSAAPNFRIFYVTPEGNLSLNSATVSGGSAVESSGWGAYGGAILNLGTFNTTDGIYSSNTSTCTGGIYNAGTATINNSSISGNSASVSGPGGLANGGIMTITNSIISNNSGTSLGGGISMGGGTQTTIINSTISGNTVSGGYGEGAGIWSNGTITVTNSTISGNTVLSGSARRGGALYNYYQATATFINSTISGNSTPSNAGGIYRYSGSTLNLRNTIVAGNTAPSSPDIYGTVNSQDYNLIGNTSGATIGGTTTHDIYNTNPLINTLASNGGPTKTHLPQAGSPVIDVIPPANCPVTTDQRGAPRPYNTNCDIGAVEVAPVACDVSTLITAITNANTSAQNDVLDLADGCTYTLSASFTISSASSSGTLTINGNGATLSRNSAAPAFDTFGVAGGGNLTLINITISGGTPQGRAIYSQGTVTIINSTISGHSATGDGGGIFNNAGTATITNSTISGNFASSRGGGIYNSGVAAITNSTISGNTANSNGGGVYNSGTAAFINSTISGNVNMFADGGGIYIGGGSVSITNSIISGNNAAYFGRDIRGTIDSRDYNLIQNTSDASIIGITTHNIYGIDPLLNPLADNGGPTQTRSLQPGSPAIGAGSCVTATDQRGTARPQGATCDIGAYEVGTSEYTFFSTSFVTGSQTVSEGTGTVTVAVQLVVPAGSASPFPSVTVTVADAGTGTATSGTDYTAFAPTTVTFTGLAAGNTYTQNVTLTLLEDAIFEASETIVLSITGVTGPTNIVSSSTHTVTITDNDPVLASFTAASQTVNEADGTITATVQVVTPPQASIAISNVTVTVGNAGTGSATSGADYTAFAPATLTFTGLAANNTYTQNVTLTILEDLDREDPETVALSITGVTGPSQITTPSTHTVTIEDNDQIMVSFTAASQSVAETAGAVAVEVQLVVLAGVVEPIADVTVTVEDAGTGSAASGTDYTAFAPTQLTFTGLAAGNTYTQNVLLDVLNDVEVETPETVALTINSVTDPGQIISPDTHTVTITDNDPSVLAAFTANAQMADETAGAVLVGVQLAVPAGVVGVIPDMTVTIGDAGTGSATSGVDYAAFASTPLTFTGLAAGTTYVQTVTVTLTDDADIEPPENVMLAITGADTPVAIDTPDEHSIVIDDDDSVIKARFTAAAQVIDETGSTVTVEVSLVVPAGLTGPFGDVVVTVEDVGTGSATSDSDYTAFAPAELTFTGLAAGNTYTDTVTLDVLDDTDMEGAETVALAITTITGPAEIRSPDTHTVVINDDDSMPILADAAFVATGQMVNEAAGTVTAEVSLTVPADMPEPVVDVVVTVEDAGNGSAVSGSDYTAFAPSTLTFTGLAAGNTYTQNVTLDVLDDGAVELPEIVVLSITGVTGPAQITRPDHSVTIADNDSLVSLLFSVNEQEWQLYLDQEVGINPAIVGIEQVVVDFVPGALNCAVRVSDGTVGDVVVSVTDSGTGYVMLSISSVTVGGDTPSTAYTDIINHELLPLLVESLDKLLYDQASWNLNTMSVSDTLVQIEIAR